MLNLQIVPVSVKINTLVETRSSGYVNTVSCDKLDKEKQALKVNEEKWNINAERDEWRQRERGRQRRDANPLS